VAGGEHRAQAGGVGHGHAAQVDDQGRLAETQMTDQVVANRWRARDVELTGGPDDQAPTQALETDLQLTCHL
jgi:hypothetical protein